MIAEWTALVSAVKGASVDARVLVNLFVEGFVQAIALASAAKDVRVLVLVALETA